MKPTNSMTFQESLKILGIEDYASRIFHSNSHGELMHLEDYFILARIIQKNKIPPASFRSRFEECVAFAEENWKRPESVFQHMPEMINSLLDCARNETKE